MNNTRIKEAYEKLWADLKDEGHELYEIAEGALEHTSKVQAALGAAAAEPAVGEPAEAPVDAPAEAPVEESAPVDAVEPPPAEPAPSDEPTPPPAA